jgi:hypothetical protein
MYKKIVPELRYFLLYFFNNVFLRRQKFKIILVKILPGKNNKMQKLFSCFSIFPNCAINIITNCQYWLSICKQAAVRILYIVNILNLFFLVCPTPEGTVSIIRKKIPAKTSDRTKFIRLATKAVFTNVTYITQAYNIERKVIIHWRRKCYELIAPTWQVSRLRELRSFHHRIIIVQTETKPCWINFILIFFGFFVFVSKNFFIQSVTTTLLFIVVL